MMEEALLLKPKILLVDDREDNLLSIEAVLGPDGYQFTKAYSGSQALKILNTESDFAMILMDVKMPVLSGFETASLIYEREKLKHIPIIFITANYYGEDNLFRGYKSGGIDYIFKPINPEVLRAKVSIFIDLYKKNRLLIEQDQKLMEINKKLEIELNDLRVSNEKLKQTNLKLMRKISDLESILEVSDSPFQQSEFETSDLNTLVKGLLNDMQEETKSATILIDTLPSLYISPKLMRPLFKNLIANALLYRQKNIDPVIKIHSEICPAIGEADKANKEVAGKYCRIFVEDNGMGFEPNHTGEALGGRNDPEMRLTLCQKIVQHHNGYISAKSKINEGSTYIISLPIPPTTPTDNVSNTNLSTDRHQTTNRQSLYGKLLQQLPKRILRIW